jgi:aminoglycoside phosphotransferase (APT) family kinase protein
MSELFIRRERPKRDVVDQVLQMLYPGSKLGRVSRLRGGLSNRMFSVEYRTSDRAIGRFVLRLTADWRRSPGENARREFTTLQRLVKAGVPAPRPLLLDVEGTALGHPGLVISYEGRPIVNPARHGPWLRGLAQALATLHQVKPRRVDLTHLSGYMGRGMAHSVELGLPEGLSNDALAREMQTVLEESAERILASDRCLVHDDFWPGNVVWRSGRVGAIVDWTSAKLGDGREDVAQCRLDLAVTHGMEDAEAFTRSYEAASGQGVRDVWFFDLLRGVSALDSFRRWVPGYVDSGLTYMTEALMETRLRAFLQAALARSAEAT